jgi:hypothetical protein
MSYRESLEVAEHGEVLRWSTDSGSEGGIDLINEDKTYSGKQDTADSEGPTELVCERWVIKETQEADIIQSDNESEAKTDRDELNGNGERWSFEARQMDRSVVAHSNEAPLTTTIASPNITEFEAFLEHDLESRQPLPIHQTSDLAKRKKNQRTMNDGKEYWKAKSGDFRRSATLALRQWKL